jgi:hypothetical protein
MPVSCKMMQGWPTQLVPEVCSYRLLHHKMKLQ